ncbi:hypothetical protein [Synechococcus sp. PCC 7336]|uniref:hypothetical protein n=1 Tax=Synechococcus sp. PCC 7336 TaxID=195250 RepID=UPI0012E99ADF|nr:hypothetical protein [Synechococcus sp. PCC 7336]
MGRNQRSQSRPATQPDSPPDPELKLKDSALPPPPWLLRTLSIVALSFTILGLEFILDGLVRGTTLPFNSAQVPTYVPGGIFLLLGLRNLWSWHKMKQALDR